MANVIASRLWRSNFWGTAVFACITVFACIAMGCSEKVVVEESFALAEPSTQVATQSKDSKDGKKQQKAMDKGKMKFPKSEDMKFKDKIETNAKHPKNISELSFVKKDGSRLRLSEYLGKKHVILVFTEGFNGMLCPFCKTQTSRLIANYDEFKKRNCEIIVVYPGPDDRVEEFIDAALSKEKTQIDKVPFPIVLDKDFKVTDYFDIHSMHAHPSTYLIDKQGGVKFAYVGKDMTADRPSVKALLEKLDAIGK